MLYLFSCKIFVDVVFCQLYAGGPAGVLQRRKARHTVGSNLTPAQTHKNKSAGNLSLDDFVPEILHH